MCSVDRRRFHLTLDGTIVDRRWWCRHRHVLCCNIATCFVVRRWWCRHRRHVLCCNLQHVSSSDDDGCVDIDTFYVATCNMFRRQTMVVSTSTRFMLQHATLFVVRRRRMCRHRHILRCNVATCSVRRSNGGSVDMSTCYVASLQLKSLR